MGELVDQHHFGSAFEQGVEVHLLEDHTIVLDLLSGQHFEAVEQSCGSAAPVCLNDPDDDIGAASEAAARLADERPLTDAPEIPQDTAAWRLV